MKDLLKFIVENIVDHPDQVQISEEKSEELTTLKLKVADEDIGKVIGKKGRIIRAIRQLLRIKAFNIGERVNLVLEEKEEKPADL